MQKDPCHRFCSTSEETQIIFLRLVSFLNYETPTGAFGVTVFSSWPSCSERGDALTKGMETRFPIKLRRGALSPPPGKTTYGQIPKKTPEQEAGGLQVATPKATSHCCRFKSSPCFHSFNPAILSLEEFFLKGIVTSL